MAALKSIKTHSVKENYLLVNQPNNNEIHTLLIAHPSSAITRKIAGLFENEFKVEVANSANSALMKTFNKEVDLILADTSFPDLSWVEMNRALKDNPQTKSIPLMLMANNYSQSEEETALLLGAIDYFSATTSPLVILARVHNHMKQIKLLKKLKHLSCIDSLTGLPNKAQLEPTLKKEWRAAIRGNHSIAVIMADIDQFKLYNDTFGHLEGDKCLQKVAIEVGSVKRRSEDFVARFGGEEFSIILPYTDIIGAEKVASTLLDNIRQLNIKHAQTAKYPMVTCSAGVAAITPNIDDNKNYDPQQLIKEADRNLYKAKNSGRNKFC